MIDDFLVPLASASLAASIPLLWWSVSGTRSGSRAVTRNLTGGQLEVTDLRRITLAGSATNRAVRPVVRALAARARRITPAGFVDALDRRILLAGASAAWPLERVLAAKLLVGIAGLSIGLLQFFANRTLGWLLFAALLTVIGYLFPDGLLWSRSRERQKQIRLELPDTLDQMTISVEAGLGFDSSMARAGSTGKGPLAEELMRTLHEVRIGVPRAAALRNLVGRTNVAELRHFVLAVLQAEGYGIPIAQVLRVQAAELRVKRRQRAEERAMKIPVKVVFPLVLCILPTLFIVILGPAAIRISRTLLGGVL